MIQLSTVSPEGSTFGLYYLDMTQPVSSKPKATKFFLPIVFIFSIINLLIRFTPAFQEQFHMNQMVLYIGNLILFIATALAFIFYFQSVQSQKPFQFITKVYLGMLIKMLICLFSSFIYIYAAGKKNADKAGIIACMIFYLVYTVVELMSVMRANKKSQHA